MRKITTFTSTVALTGLFLTMGLASASATESPTVTTGGDPEGTVKMSSEIKGGTLTAIAPGPSNFDSLTLNGSAAQTTSVDSALWTIINARGTDAVWNLNVAATPFTSAAGDESNNVVRTIAVENLSIYPGLVKAVTGSDRLENYTAVPVTMSGTAQSLVPNASKLKGTYTFTPKFTLTVPANAYRSNFVNGSDEAMIPYISTITVTIG